MTAPSPLEQFEPLCWTLVRKYFAPGLERDDLMQIARLAVLEAFEAFNPDRGNRPSFVRLVVERRLKDEVLSATRPKHGPLNNSVTVLEDRGEQTPALDLQPTGDPGPHRRAEIAADLAAISQASTGLTELERQVLGGILGGDSYRQIAARVGGDVKCVDNAAQRARHKLAAALELAAA